MDIKKKIQILTQNDYIFTLINKVSTIILGLFTSAFINRYAGPALKGEYTILLNYVNIFAVIANLGIYQAYPYYKRKKTPNVLKKFVNIFYYQFFLYLLVFIVALFTIKNSLVITILFILPFSVLTNQLNFTMMVEYIYYRNKVNIILSIIKLILSFLLFFVCPRNIIFLVINLFLYDFILLIFYLVKLKIRISLKYFDKNFIISIVRFGIIPMITSLLINLNYKLDVLMLDKYVDNDFVGYYAVGVTLAELAWLIPDTFKDVLFAKTSNSDSIDQIVKCLKISFYAILLVILGVISLGKIFIVVMYGKEFIKSYGVTVLLFLGVPAMAWFKIISTLYLAQGKRYFYLISLLISVVLNFVANLIMIPKLSIYGAALASIISYTICGGIFLFDFIRIYKIKIKDVFLINKNDIKVLTNIVKRKK